MYYPHSEELHLQLFACMGVDRYIYFLVGSSGCNYKYFFGGKIMFIRTLEGGGFSIKFPLPENLSVEGNAEDVWLVCFDTGGERAEHEISVDEKDRLLGFIGSGD